MDVQSRVSGVSEPDNSGSDLLQSSGRAIRFADYLQEDRDGFGGRTKAEIIDGNKAAFEKGEPALEPGHELHNVEASVHH